MTRGARTWLALTAALALHALAALVFAQLSGRVPPLASPAPRLLDVVLVTAPDPSAPARPGPATDREPPPAIQPGADPQGQTLIAPQPAPEPVAQSPQTALAPATEAEPASEPASQTLQVLAAPGGDGAPAVNFETPSGQGGALRGVACAGAGQAMREALGCDASLRVDLTAYGRPGAVDSIHARFSVSDGVPSPEAWLMLGLQPRTGSLMAAPDARLAASDSMRDRLPAVAPDPAFGD